VSSSGSSTVNWSLSSVSRMCLPSEEEEHLHHTISVRAGFMGAQGPRWASQQTAHILFLANESADDFFIDVLLQFASVTVY